MPWTPAQHRLFSMCSTPAGRAKANTKCPSVSDSKRMMKEGIKSGSDAIAKHKKKHGIT